MNSLFLFLVLFAYLCGSVPFGKIISRLAEGLDITAVGSGNIGATNVAREVGLKWGVLTLVSDALKGFVPAIAVGFLYTGSLDNDTATALAGLAALVGHQFSIFLRFSGGKGVATALGVFLALCPVCVVPAVAVFLGVVYFWNYVSVGSMAASACMPVFFAVSGRPPVQSLLVLLMASLIVFAHRGNIARLVGRRERKWRNRPFN